MFVEQCSIHGSRANYIWEKKTTSSSLQPCFVVAHSSGDLMRINFTIESNHPPITTKNIPAGINKRLSSLSSDKASFDQAAPPYQKALDESGYHYTLQYEPAKASKRKNRQRNNILWYNKNTSTNIGHKFLALVDKQFPNDHKLRKIFNRNTIKISYSCMNNTKQIIDNHNKRILTASTQIDNTAAAAANIREF